MGMRNLAGGALAAALLAGACSSAPTADPTEQARYVAAMQAAGVDHALAVTGVTGMCDAVRKGRAAAAGYFDTLKRQAPREVYAAMLEHGVPGYCPEVAEDVAAVTG